MYKYLGNGTYTNTDLTHMIEIGKYSSIGENCNWVNPHLHLCVENRKCVFTTNFDQPDNVKDKIIIGNDVWLGEGVKIIPPVKIGDGAIIGAYTVLAKDVPPYAIVVGNPQVIKRYRFTSTQIKKLLKIKWWDWDKKKIESNIELMKDINKFLQKYEK